MLCLQRAQTLPELLITLSVLAGVLGLITPALSTMLQNSRHTSEINQLHSSINYARAMAIRTGTMVSICSGDDRCAGTRRWRGKLLIFVDANQSGTLDGDEQLLKVMDIDPRHSWDWANFRQRTYLSLRPNGMTHSLNGTFTLCDGDLAIRGIVINITGRAKASERADPDRCRD
ncbi:GspH/FimT family pseudopilin [Ectopseudomonas khazarica]|uniref:GspH/FimT family pseudopilin n=1 Tax=Ectopseudomonas khazarica TaxID=2502979 RepID=UPI00106E8748|nr:GspH/FimT family protein [Pseudomonas khazarica]